MAEVMFYKYDPQTGRLTDDFSSLKPTDQIIAIKKANDTNASALELLKQIQMFFFNCLKSSSLQNIPAIEVKPNIDVKPNITINNGSSSLRNTALTFLAGTAFGIVAKSTIFSLSGLLLSSISSTALEALASVGSFFKSAAPGQTIPAYNPKNITEKFSIYPSWAS